MHSSILSFSAVLCSNPVGINNGTVMFNTTSIGSTATYSCDSGFELIGATTTTCTEMDSSPPEFSPQPPVCRREYCTNVIGVAINLILCESYRNEGFKDNRRSACIYEKFTEAYGYLKRRM